MWPSAAARRCAAARGRRAALGPARGAGLEHGELEGGARLDDRRARCFARCSGRR
uniref:Uncharacterized protein n=1 Tax=Arundo donax TaxID=35708 RepID=A0A0A9BZL6_ARUDO